MRLSLAATVGALLGLALAFGACGGERTATADKSGESLSAAGPTERKEIRSTATVKRCPSQLSGFLTSLDALRERLARGLTYDDYLREMRAVRSRYDGINVKRLPLGCLFRSGGPAEQALNLYVDAANTWGDCLTTISCDTGSIEPRLRRTWALASDRLSVAQRGLRPAAAR